MKALVRAQTHRSHALDALRGLAMIWMTVFHFCFDLNHLGLIQQNFYQDAFWTWQRSLIVSLFLLCAGMGQAVALSDGHGWGLFWRRWRWVLLCSLLVSAGSRWMFPQTWIYFGVLHGMAVMLVVVRLTARLGWHLWWLGGLAIASKFVAAYALSIWLEGQFDATLNAPAWNWIGWITRKPVTEDFVPVFPWLGVMWWGVAAGQWLLAHRPHWFIVARPQPLVAGLATLGQWSLSYYMLHQPVLIGLLTGWIWLFGPVG